MITQQVGLRIFFKALETDCNRFEQADRIRKPQYNATD